MIAHILTDNEIRRIAEVGQALSDETRIKILRLLDERPLSVGEIVDQFELAQPTISRHLAVLRRAGLVSAERARQHVIYRLDNLPDGARTLLRLPEIHADRRAPR